MSAHEESGIALSIGHEQQSYRLLELPPPLLELVMSSTPPTYDPDSSTFPAAFVNRSRVFT